MKYLIPFILIFTFSYADDLKEGHKLYKEANCAKCHLDGSKFDPNSVNKEGLAIKAKNFKSVKQWIVNCDAYFEVGWFDDEQEKVAKYINSIFYKYKEK